MGKKEKRKMRLFCMNKCGISSGLLCGLSVQYDKETTNAKYNWLEFSRYSCDPSESDARHVSDPIHR